MKHVVRNACKKCFKINQSAVGTTEKILCRAYSTFNIIMIKNAGVPCFALHRLPIFCRHYVTFFRILKLQNFKILEFQSFRVLEFFNSRVLPKRQGLERHPLRDNGNWDSGTGIWDWGTGFWERGKMKRAKIERKARRLRRNALIKTTVNGLRTTDGVTEQRRHSSGVFKMQRY